MTFALFWYEASKEATDKLPKYCFDLVALKVIVQGQKGQKIVNLS